jgi:hypothetical protein
VGGREPSRDIDVVVVSAEKEVGPELEVLLGAVALYRRRDRRS